MDANTSKNISVSVKEILRTHWFSYLLRHAVRDIEQKEVEKALNCYGHDNGCFVYYCKHCNAWIFQSLGCNGRLCSCCGKRYTDQWSKALSKHMFAVPHRHFVISVPNALWPFLKEDRSRWKVYMDSAIDACDDYFPKLMRKHNARVGIIVVLHPFGKDMKFQPHLHLIITEGAFDSKGRFIKQEFVPARKFAKCWQYHVLKNLQAVGLSNQIASEMYKKYDGFYVWVHKAGRIAHPKHIAKYLGRYVRHPAIANSRIDWFNENNVSFHYHNHEEIKHTVVISVDDFISALIQHIPEKQFKMIQYYGAYARRTKKRFRSYLQSSILQLSLFRFGLKKEVLCPFCHQEIEFVWYSKKPPPITPKEQRELVQWISCSSLN